ncbi:MAG TPA: hypothetical protein VGD26_09445 [Chitinophagaceae bacterium]
MARKKEKDEEKKEYDILIGFVKFFNFTKPEDLERLNGHPIIGRVYRLLKDPFGWRIHLGRQTNQEGLDGLYLGEVDIEEGLLHGEQPQYRFAIEIVTPTNYLELPIPEEDRQKVLEWIETDNKDLWDNLNKERSGESAVIRSGGDLLKLLLTQRARVEAGLTPSASSADRERALEATLTLMTHFQNKPVDQLAALYDAMYGRILKALQD